MIDKETFLYNGDEGVKAVIAAHREHKVRRAVPLALLLTEVKNAPALARLVTTDVDKERRLLRELLQQVDEFEAQAEPWVIERPGRRVTLPARRPRHREILLQTLSELEDEQARCDRRLAARASDAQRGETERPPDPDEEPDPVVRIWAARLRENLDAAGMPGKIRELELQFSKAIIGRRKKNPGDPMSQ
jgi:hypothetical protein